LGLLSVFYSKIEIESYSLSPLSAFFMTFVQIILSAGMLYFLILWIIDLVRRRGGINRPENKKIRLAISIIFIFLVLMITISGLVGGFTTSPLSNCLNRVQKSYEKAHLVALDDYCSKNKITENCLLPLEQERFLEGLLNAAKENCAKNYSQR
jgi:predicted PurR-regulated permease PerM